MNNTFKAPVNEWNVNTALRVSANKVKLVFNGQGLGETKWKGCAWKLLLIWLVILCIYHPVILLFNFVNNWIEIKCYISLVFH